MERDPLEMDTLAESVGEVTDELKLRAREAGSYLPLGLVERQERLARMSESRLTAWLADMVIAAALRDPTSTPRQLLEAMLRDYRISDESWREKVRPELARVLRGRGVDTDAWAK